VAARAALKPGDWVAIALVAEALAIDAVLVARRHETISTCVRSRRAGKAMTVLLCAHLLRTWKRDPLVLLGNRWETYTMRRLDVAAR
jgi:hypothetical protein